MRKNALLMALLCGMANVLWAQSVLRGKVVDEEGTPLVGARVWLEYTTIGGSTNDKGEFVLLQVPEGTYTLRATSINYNGAKQTVDASKSDVLLVLKSSPLKLDEVVVTGTGTHRRLKNSPVAIDVISKKELNNVAALTFEDAMTAINPSFSVTPNAMGSHLRLNGLSNRYVQIMVNGRKLAGDVSGNIDLSRINLSHVKRIEVLKGAASALYGSDAMGGVINIITDAPKEKVYVTSDTRYARYGQFTQSINANVNAKWLTSMTSYQRNQSDGWQLSGKEENSSGELVDTEKKAVNAFYTDVFNQKFIFKPTQAFSFYTEGSFYDKKYKRSPAAYTYDMKYEDYTLAAGAKYLLRNKGVLTLDFHTDNFEYYREYITASGTYEVGDKTKERRQKYYDANLKGVFGLGQHHNLSLGTQYQLDYIESTSDVKDGSRDLYTYSVYAQDEIKLLGSKLQLVPGARYIYNEAFGSRFTPKLSAMYALEQLNFRASYSAGFRTPDMKELYSENISRSTLSLGNPDLKPESSNYYSLNTEFHNDFLTVSVTGYLNRIKNIVQTKDISETITEEESAEGIKKKREYVNSSSARASGLEVSTNAYLGYGLTLGLSYNYSNTKDYDTGSPLVRSNKHTGTGSVNWNKKWWIVDSNVNFNGRIQSRKYFDDGDSRSYNQWNLATRHRLKSFADFALEPGIGIENIFNFVDDKPFGANYATLSPGRTFYVSLTMKFIK